MNENAKKWVAALRSVEFKQAYGTLGGPDMGYCCLGVACVVYERETGKKLPKEVGGSYAEGDLCGGAWADVRHWVGLDDGCGGFRFVVAAGDAFDDGLANLNDSREFGFDQIADIIESEPRGLFVGGSNDQ